MDALAKFFSGVFDDPIGRWIILALIIVIGSSVATFYFRNGLKGLTSRVETVREQLQNDHVKEPHLTSNLREDLDEKHEIQTKKLDRVLELTLSNTQAISGLTGQVSSLMGRIDNVEQTQENHHG